MTLGPVPGIIKTDNSEYNVEKRQKLKIHRTEWTIEAL